jgi:hypothetical protein
MTANLSIMDKETRAWYFKRKQAIMAKVNSILPFKVILCQCWDVDLFVSIFYFNLIARYVELFVLFNYSLLSKNEKKGQIPARR